MNYRYIEGWQTRERTSKATYFLALLLPAFVIAGAWASSLVG